ncbi:unnamed protein product [Urochloa decumbens]|uniref:Bifunctional inhibitor/plant lipid transfer protein/seed storage helical domain-containing protein n=1 Tax=Urochloa decumbens TaxID=240449 RepID=A0ABC8X6D3_9POAL
MAMLALAALLLATTAVRVDGATAAAAPAPAPSADCTDALLSLAGCLSYVQEGSTVTTPDPSCCSGLKDVVRNEVACLCQVFQGGQNLGISLNMTKALQLPAACKVKTPPVSRCHGMYVPVPMLFLASAIVESLVVSLMDDGLVLVVLANAASVPGVPTGSPGTFGFLITLPALVTSLVPSTENLSKIPVLRAIVSLTDDLVLVVANAAPVPGVPIASPVLAPSAGAPFFGQPPSSPTPSGSPSQAATGTGSDSNTPAPSPARSGAASFSAPARNFFTAAAVAATLLVYRVL